MKQVKKEFSELYTSGMVGNASHLIKPYLIDLAFVVGALFLTHKILLNLSFTITCTEECELLNFLTYILILLVAVFLSHFSSFKIFPNNRFRRSTSITFTLEVFYIWYSWNLPIPFWIKGAIGIALFFTCFYAYQLSFVVRRSGQG